MTTILNRVWVGDITAVPMQAGWLYVAVLLDLCSRRVIWMDNACQAGSTADAGRPGYDGASTALHPVLIYHLD